MANKMEILNHGAYGQIPKHVLRLYKKANISPSEHIKILSSIGVRWSTHLTPGQWRKVVKAVESRTARAKSEHTLRGDTGGQPGRRPRR